MKKLILCICSCFCLLFSSHVAFADCKVIKETDGVVTMSEDSISDVLNNCLEDTTVYIPKGDATIEGGLRTAVLGLIQNIALFLGLLSVFGIVLGSLFLTLSGGVDDKIDKGKNIIKWSILGLLVVMFSGTFIVILVNILYAL